MEVARQLMCLFKSVTRILLSPVDILLLRLYKILHETFLL